MCDECYQSWHEECDGRAGGGAKAEAGRQGTKEKEKEKEKKGSRGRDDGEDEDEFEGDGRWVCACCELRAAVVTRIDRLAGARLRAGAQMLAGLGGMARRADAGEISPEQ